MSLPKRDGVHDRYYLIHKPNTSPEVLAEADLCIQDVLNGTARENHSAYPTVVRNHNGTPFLPDQLLERYLSKLPLKGFPYEEAVVFCDALRRLAGWNEIRYTLEKYIEKQVQERYFLVGERDDGFTVFPPCTVWPELRPEDVDEGLLRFACYVAVCCTVYGQSFESLKTEHILGLVSQLRPDLVKQLKTAGSGKLPKDIQRRKTEHFTASANDAFATIRITAKDSTEECYAEILDYLCAVLSQEEFPRSYSVEFRGKEKLYLPIPGLPKKGINQLFACAVQHPNLHPAMERYARLANSPTLDEEKLHQAIQEAINEFVQAGTEVKEDMLTFTAMAWGGNTVGGVSLIDLRQKLKDITDQQALLLDQVLEHMDDEILNARLKAMMDEKQALQERIADAEQSETHNAAQESRMAELREWMAKLEVNQQYSDEQVRMAVERITVVDAETIRIRFRYPGAELEKKL